MRLGQRAAGRWEEVPGGVCASSGLGTASSGSGRMFAWPSGFSGISCSIWKQPELLSSPLHLCDQPFQAHRRSWNQKPSPLDDLLPNVFPWVGPMHWSGTPELLTGCQVLLMLLRHVKTLCLQFWLTLLFYLKSVWEYVCFFVCLVRLQGFASPPVSFKLHWQEL